MAFLTVHWHPETKEQCFREHSERTAPRPKAGNMFLRFVVRAWGSQDPHQPTNLPPLGQCQPRLDEPSIPSFVPATAFLKSFSPEPMRDF